jgi:putative salt-induced outer membrane protein YdiY
MINVLLVSLVFGAEPTFDGTRAAEVKEKPETHLTAELGGTYTSGNAMAFSLTGGAVFSHKWEQNQFGADAGFGLSQGIPDANADGRVDATERTAGWKWNSQRVQGNLRYDRFFGKKNSLYLLAGASHDRFAGFDMRWHAQLGYARVLSDSEKFKLKVELGADYTQEFWTDTPEQGIDNQFIAARALLSGSYKFNEHVSFSDDLEMFENFFDLADFRLYNTAALNVRLSKVFSLKVSHRLAFDNVPVPDFQKLDQTTQVTFVAAIF